MVTRETILERVKVPYPFNLLSENGIYTTSNAAKEKANTVEKYLKKCFSEDLAEAIIDHYKNGTPFPDSEEHDYDWDFVSEAINKKKGTSILFCYIITEQEACMLYYGESQHKKILNKAAKFDDDFMKLFNDAYIDSMKSVLHTNKYSIDDIDLMLFYESTAFQTIAISEETGYYAYQIIEFCIENVKKPPFVSWSLKDFNDDWDLFIYFFKCFGKYYYPELYKDGTLQSPFLIYLLSGDIDYLEWIQKYSNVPFSTDEDLLAGYTEACEELYKSGKFSTLPDEDMDELPEEILQAFRHPRIVGLLFLGKKGFDELCDEDIGRSKTGNLYETAVDHYDFDEPLVPMASVTDILNKAEMTTLENLREVSVEFLDKGLALPKIAIDLIRYKMMAKGYKFLTYDSYKKKTKEKDRLHTIVDLYACGYITDSLYLALKAADLNYSYLTALDGMMVDEIIPTYGLVAEFEKIMQEYDYRVYTRKEFEDLIAKSKGDKVPIGHLISYLSFDEELGSAIMDQLDEFYNGNKFFIYVSDLKQITYADYIVMSTDPDDKYQALRSFLIYFQSTLPAAEYRLASSIIYQTRNIKYPREIDSTDGFFKQIDIDRDGIVTYQEIEDYVVKQLELDLLPNIEADDPSDAIKVITDTIFYMPETGAALFDPNVETTDKGYLEARDTIQRSSFVKIMPALKKLLFVNDSFTYVLIMLLIRWTVAAKEKNDIDPFK